MAEKLAYASAARTATPASYTFSTGRAKEARIVIDVTAITSTPSVVFTVDMVDSLSGKFPNIITSAALVATGTVVLTIALGATVAANVAVSAGLSEVMRITPTHGNANSITYSVSVHLR